MRARGEKRIFLDLNLKKIPKNPKNPKNPIKSQKILENPKKSHKIQKCKIESGFQQYSLIIFSSASNMNKQC
jgi:hypothetical protein